MLKELILRNFQRHEKLRIKFDERVTSITGPNDAGKSAILRAIRAICLRPAIVRGYRTKGKSYTKIIVKTEKHRIERRVGKGNTYKHNGKVYRAFRGKVPEGIERVFNLAEINFQKQHEPVFWFNLSPGAVARELNQLVDLDSIDAVQSDIAKQLRDKRAELEVAKSRLAEAESEVEKLKWVPQLAAKLDKLHKLYANAVESPKLARIRVLIGAAMVYAGTMQTAAIGAVAAANVVAIGGAVRGLTNRAEKLRQIVARLESAHSLSKVQIPRLPPLPEHDEELAWRLEELIIDHQKKEKELCQVQKLHQEMHERLRKLLKGKCPVCGRRLDAKRQTPKL